MSSLLAATRAGEPTGASDRIHTVLERRAARRVLPHEVAFAVLYGVVLLALLVTRGTPQWTEVGIWLALLGTSAGVVILTIARPSATTWRVRLGAYLVLMNAAYFRMAHVVRAVYGGLVSRDSWLQAADTTLFGRPVPLYLERWSHPLLSDVLSACYFLLFPYILISVGRRLHGVPERRGEAQRFIAGLFTVYGIGLLGYLLLPAAGAYLSMPNAFSGVLTGGWMTHLTDAVVRHGSNRVDVFPSLHIAVSAFILGFDRRYARWRYRVYLAPAIGLWISTIYLRFHYGIDVIAGFAVAAFGLWIAFRTDTSDCRLPWSVSP